MLSEVKFGQSGLAIYVTRYFWEVCMILSQWWDGGPCVVGLFEVRLGKAGYE